jgi:CRISPR-associated protein Csd1
MLLEQLRALESPSSDADGEGGGGLPPGYKSQPIPWLVHLEPGKGASLQSTSSGGAGPDRGKKYPAPYLRRSGTDVKPQLLADKAEFVFGVPDTKDKTTEAALARAARRARARQADFLALVEACAEVTGLDPVRRVAEFLRHGELQALLRDQAIPAGDAVSFRVGTAYPIGLPPVREFWASVVPHLSKRGVGKLGRAAIVDWLHRPKEASAPERAWQCLVCGNPCAPERVHPVGIALPRTVSDRQCALVSANQDAFCSYGLEQSLVAPTCRGCAERYGRELNRLVAEKHTHITIGPTVYVFRARGNTWSPASILSNPEPGEARQLLVAAFGGDRAALRTDPAPFWAAALSANGARVVVRDWLETTIPRARRSLARYVALQEIVNRDGSEGDPVGLYALAAATARDPSRDLPAEVPRALLRVALAGGELPEWLLFQAVKRNRAEQRVTRPRAALIKMVLLSREEPEFPLSQEHRMVTHSPDDPILNDPRKRQAYYCGCLLAVLERAQRAALGETNTTLVGRFFGTASSAPASVFGRLMRMSQVHLEKLRREKPGAYRALRQHIQDITHPHLPTFPRTLTLEEQGLFSLGYYHQHAKDRAEAAARKKANDARKKAN